jgi:phage protein D
MMDALGANKAGIRLILDDDTDLADKIDPRFVSLTLVEKRDGSADELTLSLQNADGKLAVPTAGRILSLWLGWDSRSDAMPVGLINKGRFRVDEVEEGGPPDAVTIRARSADMAGGYAKRRNRVWHATTLGSIVNDIAARHGVTAHVHPDLASEPIEALEQHNKADMAMVYDLGKRFDAVATWKDRKIIIMPKGASTTVNGKVIPTISLTRQDGWSWRFKRAERGGQTGVEAQYHDSATGARKTVSQGSGEAYRLKHVYASKSSAQRAAKSNLSKRQREKHQFEYYIAVADCRLQPNQQVTLSGWGETVSGTKWLIDSIETSMEAGGIKQMVRFEGA